MSGQFDRVLLVRHIAICAGAAMAWILRAELQIGYAAVCIVGVGALLNCAAFVFRTRPRFSRVCVLASPFIGVGSWTALILVTRGVSSPFVAGLWLEIALSAMALRPPGIFYVTAGSVAALSAQQLWLGLSGVGTVLILQCGFLVGMGAATFLVTRRWARAQRSLTNTAQALEARLDSLEIQLEDERAFGRLGGGESVGRLAHGLKNTVHSLRGFANLIAPRAVGPSNDQALEGLRAAIDELESIALLTLEEGRASGLDAPSPVTPDARAAVEAGVRDIQRNAPDVTWSIRLDGESPALRLPEAAFREVLDILLRNAVEAMNGSGSAEIRMFCGPDELRTLIENRGTGLTREALSNLYRPGYTTKPKGSGYGLFLAHRIAHEHGGRLSVRPAGALHADAPAGHGTVAELSLPLAEEPGAAAASSES